MSNRLILAETTALTSETLSCLTKLARGQELRAQVVIREAQTGKLKAAAHHVQGPCALLLIVSRDGEGRGAKLPGAPFLPVQGMEEISEKDQLAWALRQEGMSHLQEKRQRERIIAKHQALQKMLKPYAVIHPHTETILKNERDPVQFQRLAGLARAVAFLRQAQKQVRSYGDQDYLEVTEADLQLALGLSKALAERQEYADPERRVLESIRRHVSGNPEDSFTRSQVQGWTGLKETAVREHLARLEAEGRLERVEDSTGQGRTARYRLILTELRPLPPLRTPSKREVQNPQPVVGLPVVDVRTHFAPFAPQNGDG